jgi:hypothetical protein
VNDREAVVTWIEEAGYEDEGLLLADGYEPAFLGVAVSAGRKPVAVYDIDACINVLMERDGMSYEEAEEFFSFNTLGAYVGEQTPLYINRRLCGTTDCRRPGDC